MPAALPIVMVVAVLLMALFPMVLVTLALMVVMLVIMLPVLMVVMVVLMPAALLLVVMVALSHFFQKIIQHGIPLLDDLQKLAARKLGHGSCHNGRLRIFLPDHVHILPDLGRVRDIRTAQDNGSRVLNLVVEELAEILHIHLALGRIHNGDRAVERHVHVGRHINHSLHHIGELAHA